MISIGIILIIVTSKMECIICQDSGTEPLQDNTACSCKYKRHTSCWIDYVHSTTNLKCLMCRKDLSVKATPKSKSPPTVPVRLPPSIPYSPQRTPDEETGQQITYQEFIDTVAQSNSYQHTRNIEVQPSIRVQQPQQQVVQKPISKFKKCLKIALCLVIIIVIVIVFITVV